MTRSHSVLTPEQVREVLATAVRAPSVQNTQPWQFALNGDTISVRADRQRQLTQQDPLGRELVLSCGGAAVHAQLAVRSLGLRCDLSLAPLPGDLDHVATLVVSSPLLMTAEEVRLLEAVGRRHTDRTAFAPTPVPATLVAELRAAAGQYGGHLTAEERPDRVLALEVLVARADRTQRSDAALRDEQAAWVHPGRSPDQGLPTGALPDHGAGRGSSLTLRDLEPQDGPALAGREPPTAEHPLLLLLSTDGDEPEDWARAGAALARVLLTATAAGLVANPQTQVLEVPGLRARLVADLGLSGQPQMLLRVGYPSATGSPATGRRPVAEVLTASSADGPGPEADGQDHDPDAARMQALTHDECLTPLATQRLGRLGVIAGGYPLIVLVNFDLDHGVVVLRSRAGTKLDAAQHANATLEVDQIDPLTQTGWSVLVRGLAEEVTDRHPVALVERTHAVAGTPRAPGEHDHWLRLIPHRVTGRRLVAAALPPAFESAGYL